jgi:chemotaxis protein histidine kinase CheA
MLGMFSRRSAKYPPSPANEAYPPADGPLWQLVEHAGQIASQLNKSIAIAVEHAGVRIPPLLVDGFCEALVPVVRNAIDHGFESPEARLAAGKSPIGLLELVTRVGAEPRPSLVLEIRDDGAGIEFDAVRRKALKRGIQFEDTERGLKELLFLDSFSNREHVTGSSGGGVGLSAVKAWCIALGGTFEVESRPGKGTSFRFRFAW